MMEREWRAPDLPGDPVERLVAMGFGNREQNKQLLVKHNHELQVATRRAIPSPLGRRVHMCTIHSEHARKQNTYGTVPCHTYRCLVAQRDQG